MTPPSPRANPIRQIVKRGMMALLPKGLFVVRGPATGRNICLTFDDGPHPQFTPRILDVLKAHRAKATFFAIGERADANPIIIRRILAEGHTLGSHTYHHVDLSKSSVPKAIDECRHGRDVLTLAGARVKYLRPPWGKMAASTLPIVAASGMSVALWNKDSMDFRETTAASVIENVTALQPAPGDILLFHDDRSHTAEALDAVLVKLKECDLTAVTLEVLMSSV